MKNPFIAIAAVMSMALARMRQQANADFYTSRKPSRASRRKQSGPAQAGTGSKLSRKASEHRLGTMRGAVATNIGRQL